MSERGWSGEVALVTGASSGIGRAVALALSRAGMRVAVCARRGERLAALVESLPGEGLAVATDLRDLAAIDALFATVRARWGGVDVLVNNAGLGRAASLLDGEPAAWREMLELNVLALCACTQHAVRDMRARGDEGHVIHIGSMSGHRLPETGGVYPATKFAVRALTEGLRRELRALDSGVRVSAISPGYVETEFAAVYSGDERAARETYGRFPCLQPEDVAEAVLYALRQPAHVQVHDVLLRPTRQPS